MPDQPDGAAPVLTGGPDREYRSGEIEPSQVIQPQQGPDGDWEEKTVVDDSQLYNTKDGSSTIGTTTGEEELTIDEPSKTGATGMGRFTVPARPTPPPARPAPMRPAEPAARPKIAPTPGAVPESAQGKLVVIAGNDAGREFPLHGKAITVGRGIDNDVVLTDIAVSRKHMSIAFDGSRYQLTDKGSGNGTIINQRVETGTRPLSHGDRIEIGNTVFRFEHPASEKEPWAAGAQAKPAPAPPKLAGSPPPPALPASPPRPAPPDSGGPPPVAAAASGPPATLTGSSPVGDAAFELPQPESTPGVDTSSTWVPQPLASSPATPAAASALAPPAPVVSSSFASPGDTWGAPSPAYAPLVPRGPISGRQLLAGAAATFAGLIGAAIAGMLLGGHPPMAAEPPVRVEDMLLPLLEPLLELGAEAGAVPPGIEPDSATPEETPSSPEPAGAEPAGAEPASAEAANDEAPGADTPEP